jgi:tRNA modification GTPase
MSGPGSETLASEPSAIRSDTIYALSSGNPPAAIAIVRISGPGADGALEALAGRVPPPRRASLAALHHPATGELLDNALILRFPGPGSATGEDLAELHLHGGRSVVSAILSALSELDGMRPALPGEFTRRAFENGRIDLAEAEGLSDLLVAETQSQRRAALALAGGMLSRAVRRWQDRILALSAQLEAVLDFSDEGDVGDEVSLAESAALEQLLLEMEAMLSRPSSERLQAGIRVVISGPPNAGKSSLLNWLAGRQAAITSAVAGTTRDLVEVPTAIEGSPFVLVDTAGLRRSEDEVEAIGIARAEESLATADLILWLGNPEECPDRDRAILVQSKADLQPEPNPHADINVSAETGEGMNQLAALLVARSRALLPQEGEVAINRRHQSALAECLSSLREARAAEDIIIASEALRNARMALDRITGHAGVEDMLDALFGRFCIGK